MNPILKNILAVIAGVVVGSVVNMLIIMISSSVIPPPNGADITTMEGLKESMHLMKPQHFLMPFLAHAIGTLSGAFLTAFIAANHKKKLALLIGGWFMIGGIVNIIMLPSPVWFTVLDLVVAYFPMAYLAGSIIEKKTISA